MKNRLKVLRAERDWTQVELAEALEVPAKQLMPLRQVNTIRACLWLSKYHGCLRCLLKIFSRTRRHLNSDNKPSDLKPAFQFYQKLNDCVIKKCC